MNNLGCVAGAISLAVAGVAYGQPVLVDRAAVPIKPGGAHQVFDAGGGAPSPREGGLHVAYDSTRVFDAYTGERADSLFYSVLGGHAADSMTISLPRAGMGPMGRQSAMLDELTFQVVWTDAAFSSVRVHHFFYDEAMYGSPGGEGMLLRPLGGFVATAYPCDFVCSGTTVTGISSVVPIVFSDNYVVHEMIITDENDVRLPEAAFVFSGDGTASGHDGVFAEGRSDDLFFYDANGNDYFDENEWLYYFGGGPFKADFYLRLSVLSCDADIDASGFVDTDDFDAFITAFTAGC